tara:strand:- start:720 stop:1988 length:1269 start_codon:yes stop_codon:yes gene_type:complete
MEITKPHLTSYQKNILFSEARYTITEASTKAGKTHSHILWLYGKAHEEEDAIGKNYWWVAPVYNQAKIAYKRLKRNLTPYGIYNFNETNLIITCPNGAEIHFKSAEKPDNLFGEDVYACVFDEAPRAREEAWFALRSTLTATEAPCKLIGNFGGISNWVHKLKEKSISDPAYEYFKVTCWDAVAEGILSQEEVEQAKKDLPLKIFKALYEAEQSEDEGQLIQNESIVKVFKNKFEGGVKYITADIARLGKDKTVIFVWDGLKVIHIKEMATSLVTESASAINVLVKEYNVNRNNIIVDEDGVGGGVVDILKCVGFVNNSRPIKVKGKVENFSNLKTQCYYKLSEMINRNEIAVDCFNTIEKELIQELEWVRLSKELDANKITLMSKTDIKKQIGRSPDYSDALMMRMFPMINPNVGKYNIHV